MNISPQYNWLSTPKYFKTRSVSCQKVVKGFTHYWNSTALIGWGIKRRKDNPLYFTPTPVMTTWDHAIDLKRGHVTIETPDILIRLC